MKTLSKLAVGNDVFVVETTTGNRYHVSTTCLTIMRALMEERSDAHIVEQLSMDYDVTIDDALRDVSDFRGQLKTAGLL
ncbi:MAG: HPr-rel-A system PqqD family protein [Verrucomicrobiales bacterium]|nr:HPr-rel-A system PqqD family protein [Verrucomicrobiales bacterium]